MRARVDHLFFFLILNALVHGYLWDADFKLLCEKERLRLINETESLKNDTTFVCGQEYSKEKLPAASIKIPLTQCLQESPGWEKSKLQDPAQWAGPLVGFLLPSLGFIMAIPREWDLRVEKKSRLSGGFWIPIFWMAAILVALIIDTLLGVVIVFGWAGPFIAGAVHEAWVDHATLKKVKQRVEDRQIPITESDWFALAITLDGSFEASATQSQAQAQGQHGPAQFQTLQAQANLQPARAQTQTFADIVQEELAQQPNAVVFLNRLCTQLSPFGQQVGVPLLFYVGAFIYSLVDARARLRENNTAHSVAFGLWYFVFVLVAIAGSTVLGVGAPETMESVLAHRRLAPNGCKLKWLSGRRLELARWSELEIQDRWNNANTLHPDYKNIFHRSYIAVCSCLIALIIIAVPCGLAIAVSYHTPELGFSCRSVTVLTYLCAQTFLITLWFFHSSPILRQARDDPKKSRWLRALLWDISIAYFATGTISFSVALSGTIMQLVGVYRNCVCKAGLLYGLPTTHDISMASVLISTDTAEMREAASLWMNCGAAGII